MAGVTVYTFNEFGNGGSHGRSGMSDEHAKTLLESETAAAELRLGRTRVPHSDEYLGDGFKVGSGDDPSYAVIVIDNF